ncbi:DUF192 domain-containing protein [Allopusillimonas ginsengisoli]|uniref:DUF192 domain-containing protein n=1 Tax=Allopusillimonas ginsengisoli TaxID=453575 RepID=UPI0010227BB9|nr:DUF192 domain-containing protein [Allopusillimonas ginsengisoli]TEA77264.1 DUF192 domain-containing protein [Allopusillimonas ginsengisoli]
MSGATGSRSAFGTRLSLYSADTFWRRLRGLYGKGRLAPGHGVCLAPCNAIHTCWLRTEIDVVFLDGRGRELRCVQRLKPWRAAWCRQARLVIELPAGHCAAHPYYLIQIHEALGLNHRS